MFQKNKKKSSGSTIIEVLVSIAVVSFLTLTIYITLTSAVANMAESKQRVGAVAIANEKMEIIRNLEYEDVGVFNGIIPGPMLGSEVINRNGFEYRVLIDIRYVDDPFDGTGLNDAINTDYKLVQVKVEWSHQGKTKNVEFVSVFVPNGMETNMGGGMLIINTMTSGGIIVPNVEVHLQSIENNPTVDYRTTTDNSGSLVLQGVPSQTYRISLSKTDYENVRTYPNPPESSFTPINSDFYVAEGVLNSKNFLIDLSSDLVLKAVNIADESGIAGVNINLVGGKEIGSEPITHTLDDNSSTPANGEISYENISSGNYNIINASELGSGDYDFVGSSDTTSFVLEAGVDEEIELLFADKNTPSLSLTVLDSITEMPVVGAVVGLVGPNDFSQGNETEAGGVAFFPIVSDPPVLMENAQYSLEIRMNGYQNYSDTVDISNLTKKEIKLIPN